MDRHKGQQNRTGYPYIYDQLIFNMGAETIKWAKNSLVTNDAGTTGYPHAKE